MIGQIRVGSPEKLKAALEIVLVTSVTLCLLLIFAKSSLFDGSSASRQSLALVIWIYIPTTVIFLRGRNLEHFGITLKGWKTSLREVGVVSLTVLPPFVVTFYLFEIYMRSAPLRLTISETIVARTVFLTLFTSLPEEYFFRGYLQTELNSLLGKTHSVQGVNLGFGLILSALAFALVHALFGAGWPGLLTLFPALIFGWLREKTGGILAPTLFHGLCDAVYVTLLESLGGPLPAS